MKRYIPKNSRYKESLKFSVYEGVASEFVTRIIDYYTIPFALFLGASSGLIGLIIAIPNFISALALLGAPILVESIKSRLQAIIVCIGMQTAVLAPIGLLIFLPFPFKIFALILLISVFKGLGTVVAPAWGSLMSDYLLPTQRGRYFGGRSQIIGVAAIFAALFGGTLLFTLQRYSEITSFFIIFGVATLFRFTAYLFFKRMQDLTHKTSHHHYNFKKSLQVFITHFQNKNFFKFTLYVATTTFAAQFALPFFSVWMLKELHFNYFSYTCVLLSSLVSSLFFFPLWGKHSDVVGNAKILKRTSVLIALIPLLWILARHHVIALVIVELFSGFAWAGFNLCTTNYIYDSFNSSQRVDSLVFFNFINGIAAFCGAALGGLLLTHVPATFGSGFIFIFVLSSIIRFLAEAIISGRFSEVRSGTRKTKSIELFLSIVGIRPITGNIDDWDMHSEA